MPSFFRDVFILVTLFQFLLTSAWVRDQKHLRCNDGMHALLEIQALLFLPFRFATIAWPALVEVSFDVREENKLFVLFTVLATKQTSTIAGQAFFFGFFLNLFLRDSFCHCALTRPVPPRLCQDNKTMMARKK
jgi:hypothetical protein